MDTGQTAVGNALGLHDMALLLSFGRLQEFKAAAWSCRQGSPFAVVVRMSSNDSPMALPLFSSSPWLISRGSIATRRLARQQQHGGRSRTVAAVLRGCNKTPSTVGYLPWQSCKHGGATAHFQAATPTPTRGSGKVGFKRPAYRQTDLPFQIFPAMQTKQSAADLPSEPPAERLSCRSFLQSFDDPALLDPPNGPLLAASRSQ